jgi:dipeptidyl aminopeptidase/acylaminoacyl peptidase
MILKEATDVSVLSNPRRKFKIKAAALMLMGCVLSKSNVLAAQKVRALSVEDAIKTREFCPVSPVALSPDGKLLAYTVTRSRENTVDERRTEVPWYAQGGQIYVLNIYTGEERNLTAGEGNNWLPTWSPDGLYLAFLSDRDMSGHARVWVWDETKGDLRKISDMDLKTETLGWLAGSGKLIMTTVPQKISAERNAKTDFSGPPNADSNVEKAIGSTVTLYRSAPTLSSDEAVSKSDPWDLNWALRDLTSVDVKTGAMVTVVHGKRIAAYRLSPDGSHIAYTIPKRFEKPGSQQVLFDIAVLTVTNGQSQIIATDIRFDDDGAEFSWSPESTRLIFRTGGMEEATYDCYVVSIDNGVLSRISTPQGPQVRVRDTSATPLWDRDGDHIYFVREGSLWRGSVAQKKAERFAQIPGRKIAQLVSQSPDLIWTSKHEKTTIVLTYDDVGKQDGFYEIGLTRGENSKLLEAGQCYTCVLNLTSVALSKDGQFALYFAEDAQHPSDLWINDMTFKAPRRLTNLGARFDKYHLGEVRLINWLSDDGETLEGALLLPAGYEPGKRYPLIVYVYGGASLSNHLNRFGLASLGALNMQLFSTRGFAVLLPDAPLHVGTPMFDLAKAVLPGVNKVIEIGIADGDRLGVMGHSFGGYSTLSLIVETKRFRAAMEIDGDADAIGFYGEMDKGGAAYGIPIEEEGQGSMGGTLWNRRDKYIENSPIFYLDRIATPLLIVQGTKDQAVAPFLADEVFVGLRRLGKEVEYAKYEGEGHSPAQEWSYANRTDFCERMIAWFDKYLTAGVSQNSLSSQSPENPQ